MGPSGGSTLYIVGSLSLLLAIVTFLALWGGVTLLLSDPQGPHLPLPPSTSREALASLLLFWIPITTGALSCLTGLVGLLGAGRNPDILRRALVGIFLGLAPACLAAAWLGWVLAVAPRL